MDLARQEVHVYLYLVKPGSGRGQAHEPIYPDDPSTAAWRRERMEQPARPHMLCFRALVSVARANVRVHVAALAWPKGEATHQHGSLTSAEMPPERCVVALAEDVSAEMAALRGA